MIRITTAIALLIASIAAALAQGTVTRVGPITNGDCASFNSPNTIQDGGIPCGAGHFANPTGAVGLAVVNGSATTAMRSDAAPPLSAAVQAALTCPSPQLAIGTGSFGIACINQVPATQLPPGVAANVLNTQTTNYTVANTDCGKTILLNGGVFFTITLPSVSGFAATCVVTVLNGDAGRGKALSGFPSTLPTPSILWPNQSITVAIESGGWGTLTRPGRWKVPLGTVTFADAINGNDNNDCLAAGAGSACQSIDGATRVYAKDQWDLTGSSTFFNNSGTPLIFVQLADNDTVTGTCTTCYSLVHMAFTPVGNEGRATIVIRGNTSTPGNTIISDTTGVNLGAYGAVNVELYSLQIGQSSCASSPKANSGIQAGDGANVRLEAAVILGCTTGAQFSTVNHSTITADQPFTISGGGQYLAAPSDQSEINLSNVAITCSGSPAYTGQTVFVTQGGFVNLIGTTYTSCGGVTGTKFNATFGGQIFTNTSCSITSCGIPGNANGLLGATGEIDNFIGLGTSVATNVTGLPLTTGVTGTLPEANGGAQTSAWTTFAPALTCGTATFTVNSARFKTIGKTTQISIDFSILALGTCAAGPITWTLPNTPQSSAGMAGRETNTTGKTVACGFAAPSTSVSCNFYDATTAFVNAYRVVVSTIYENQ